MSNPATSFEPSRRRLVGLAYRMLGSKRPDTWWRKEFMLRFAAVNGLPGVIVDAPDGPVQTAAFEIEGNAIRTLYVVRNPDKLRHLAAARMTE
jgi:hypothetical protein